MTKAHVGIAALVILLASAWYREGGLRAVAEYEAARQDSIADAALDRARADSLALVASLASLAASRAAYEDSLVVWGARAEEAQRRALVARRAAQELTTELEARLASDTTGSVILAELTAQHAEEVQAVTVRAETAETRVGVLEVRVSELTAALDTSMGETREVRGALAAQSALEDALRRQLASRGRSEWAWRVVAAAGWICAAAC